MTITKDTVRRAVLVAHAREASFIELVGIAELDPKKSFVGASLDGADLRDQELLGFDFTDTTFVNSDLRGADLTKALGITLDTIRFARIDESTKLPHRGRSKMQQVALLRNIAEKINDSISNDIENDEVVPKKWNRNYYWRLHNRGAWNQLREWCEEILNNEPKNWDAVRLYAHLIGIHQGEVEKAESIIRDAIGKNAPDHNLEFELARIIACDQSRISEAIDLYYGRLMNLYGYDRNNEIVLLNNAFNAMMKKFGTRLYDDMLKKNIERRRSIANSCDELNSVAWGIYRIRGDMELARSMALKATRIDNSNTPALQTYVAILARSGKVRYIKKPFEEWLSRVDKNEIVTSWNDYEDMFFDMIKFGQGRYALEQLMKKLNDGVQ